MTRPAWFRWLRRLLVPTVFLLLTFPAVARAQAKAVQTRDALFEWDAEAKLLYLSLGFRDVIDPELQAKLSRGLPTTIVLTAAIYRAAGGSAQPLSTTAHTCRVTWHVWEEAYRVEITRPGGSQVRWTTTVEGVLRRCAEVRRLIAGTAQQIPVNTALFCAAKVQVNPLSPEVLQKLKLWVLRPIGTGTAAPSDALFSTFTVSWFTRWMSAAGVPAGANRAVIDIAS